jgi:DivIVA domain-containing protein
MALSPEDVLDKTFTTTQFRRGYDEREVDDFLDDIVAEMRRSQKESEDLRSELNNCREGRGLEPVAAPGESDRKREELEGLQARNGELEQRVSELEAQLGDSENRFATLQGEHDQKVAALTQNQDASASTDEHLATLNARVQEAERDAQERIARANEQAAAAEQEAQQRIATLAEQGQAAPAAEEQGHGGAAAAAGVGSAAGVLALAQKLHDEHVATGEARRDELINAAQTRHDELMSTGQTRHDELLAEGTARRDEMITEARERSTGMVHEAQSKKAQILEELNSEKSALEAKIEQLRGFERDYRARLKEYITGQLNELDHTAVDAPDQGEAEGEPAQEQHQG